MVVVGLVVGLVAMLLILEARLVSLATQKVLVVVVVVVVV